MNQSGEKSSGLDLDPLDQVGWLSRQSTEFKQWVADNGRWRRFAAGEIIYLAGEEPNGMYGLGSGALEITFPLQGEEAVTLHRAEPGFWIGEAALMASGARLVSLAAALESRVLHLPIAPLKALLLDDPNYWRILYEQSFDNLTVAVTLLAEALSLRPRARLAKLLLRLADDNGRVNASQDDFSRLIGMTRSSVRRAVGSLLDAGVVRTGYGWLDVVDVERLKAISRES